MIFIDWVKDLYVVNLLIKIDYTMESNRDEAKRCLRLALEAYRNESLDTAVLEKAKRLTRKSIRLYPSEEAEGKCLKTTPKSSALNYLILSH